jgi:flagellar hook-length control protein FliK
MGIDTTRLTLGSSMPAKSVDAGQAAPTKSANAAGSDPASATPAGGNAQTGSSNAGSASGQQPTGSTGASAQTRSNARATRSRTSATPPAASPTGTEAQDAAAPISSDFGSVMASALGRGAAAANPGSALATPATTNTDSATTTPPAQPAAGAPANAIAWFTQAFLPPAPGAQPVATAAASAAPGDPAGAAIGALAAGGAAQTPRALAAQLATQNALSGGQSADQAAAIQLNAPGPAQTQAAPTSDAALSVAMAAPAGNLNALADVQKLIAGVSGANPSGTDPDPDADSATPKAHAVSDSGSNDTAQATAALQASSLAHPNSSLGEATLTIHAPVGSAAFTDEVSARAAGLAQSGITQAQLQLNPADMGPVQVHITMQAGQASVWFGATHADTRAALEQSLPRLRELFAGAGMPLTDSGVFREPPQQQQSQSLPAAGSASAMLSDSAVAPTVTQVAHIRLALLDTYA